MKDLKYAIELYDKNERTETISKFLGEAITAMKDCHLLVRTTLGTFTAKKVLTKKEIQRAELAFTNKYKELNKKGLGEIKVIPYEESIAYEYEMKNVRDKSDVSL